MRNILTISFALLVLAGSAIADDAKDLNGTWTSQEALAAGGKLPAESKFTLVLADGKYTVKLNDMEIDQGTCKIDEKKSPKQIEIVSTASNGKKLLAIYELKGDTLKVCYDIQGNKHPTEFSSTKDNKWLLITYKRQK